MNYAPNTTPWRAGDYVLHDADAKTARMVMIVIGSTSDGLVKTRYRDTAIAGRRVWENPPAVLHDPARFAVATDSR